MNPTSSVRNTECYTCGQDSLNGYPRHNVNLVPRLEFARSRGIHENGLVVAVNRHWFVLCIVYLQLRDKRRVFLTNIHGYTELHFVRKPGHAPRRLVYKDRP